MVGHSPSRTCGTADVRSRDAGICIGGTATDGAAKCDEIGKFIRHVI